MKWVKQIIITKKTGITKHALNTKRNRGVLIEGVHWKRASDNVVYYNIIEIERWIDEY